MKFTFWQKKKKIELPDVDLYKAIQNDTFRREFYEVKLTDVKLFM